jgi:outer membrane protein assembly factor BamB
MYSLSTSETLILFCCLFSISQANETHGEDWPRWRGPRADGTWNAPKLPAQWPSNGLPRIWKKPIGGGYAGISAAEGKVFTMDLETPIAPRKDDKPDGVERILCYKLADGELLWSHKYHVKYGGLGGYNNGPRATPSFHDGKLYTLGAVGHLFCFDAATGKVIWSKDLVKDFKARIPEWGLAASPVVDGDRVIVHAGAEPNGCLIAFDRLTGNEIWRSVADPAGYCTPSIIRTKSGRQIVFFTPENIRGLDAESGKPLWSVPYKITYGVSIASPIFHEDILFITGYWDGSKAIKLGAKPADCELIYEDKRNTRGLMAQPLYRDGYVYTIDRQSGLTCIELKSGKKLWDDANKMTPKGRNPHASFVWLNDGNRILSLNSAGELILARIDPKGYEEESRTRILDGQDWGHPAFVGNFIIARTDGAERMGKGPFEIACVKLSE